MSPSNYIPSLTVYGPLGIFCIVLIIAVGYLYNHLRQAQRRLTADLKEMSESHKAEISRLVDLHTRDMNVLQERYIMKAETWMEKYQQLSLSMNTVLDKFSNKIIKR